MALEEYKRKRDFKRTPEPAGARAKKAAPTALAFVIQKHAASRLHYDIFSPTPLRNPPLAR